MAVLSPGRQQLPPRSNRAQQGEQNQCSLLQTDRSQHQKPSMGPPAGPGDPNHVWVRPPGVTPIWTKVRGEIGRLTAMFQKRQDSWTRSQNPLLCFGGKQPRATPKNTVRKFEKPFASCRSQNTSYGIYCNKTHNLPILPLTKVLMKWRPRSSDNGVGEPSGGGTDTHTGPHGFNDQHTPAVEVLLRPLAHAPALLRQPTIKQT